MTYLLFLILFLGVPIVALVLLLRDGSVLLRNAGRLAGLAAVALIYTTPWDNYLAASRLWIYERSLTLGIFIGFVPLEEYLFFVLHTLLVGLLALYLYRRFYPDQPGVS